MDTRSRFHFDGFAMERLPSGLCRAKVTLSWPGAKPFVGEAQGLTSQAGELRCSAQACLNAIAQAVHDPAFELVGVKAVRAFDATVVIVSLTATGRVGAPRIVGSCLTKSDAPRGAAIAVLNATNRLLARRAGAQR